MAVYEIPLDPNPQTFTISLGGTEYRLTVKWNAQGQFWFLDIASALDAPVVCGIPLVTGTDLLAQYAYLGFGGQLIAQTDNDPDAIPTFDNLGLNGHLYFVVTP